MAAILGKLWGFYKLVFEDLPDPRTKTWFLVAKPYQMIAILSIYLMFIFKWGPHWMRKRPALKLDKVLIVYNCLQVAACLYIFIRSLQLAWGRDYKWFCEPIDTSTEPRPMEIATTVYYYFLTKLIDLSDTIFFVLRKKYRQITFLHIYHHTGMVLLIWGAVTYLPGGHGTLIGVINCFVHVVMYSYYLYTVAVPSAKNSLWWKKYITQLQIVQFFWCVVHMAAIVFMPECAYPRWTSAVFLPQNLFILVLFVEFYIKTYMNKPAENLSHGNGHTKEHSNKSGRKNQHSNANENGSNESSFSKGNGYISSIVARKV